MVEKDRVDIPLGFQFTIFRDDNDYESAPPVEAAARDPFLPAPVGSEATAATGHASVAADVVSNTADEAHPAVARADNGSGASAP
jgi:hypothetical protein